MTLKCGIVGLPNVGKSTLFNALTATQAAEASNFPFCTITPNKGIVSVPDVRISILAKIAGSEKEIPTQMEFIDIAGLVKGASKGEGLGNQFLSHIREVDAIIHMVRCFQDDDITHVYNRVDPLEDLEIIETELMLADLESVEKRILSLEKKAKAGNTTAQEEIKFLRIALSYLEKGHLINQAIFDYDRETMDNLIKLQLITAKPIIYVCNVKEKDAVNGNEFTKKIEDYAKQKKTISLVISSKIEAEIASFENIEEKEIFLSDLGLKESGLNQIIKAAYKILNLSSFFTIGPKEARAWTFLNGTTAQKAAGIIHTDFEKGFIRAETIDYSDYINYNGEIGTKNAGKLRLEGKEYLVCDGDILHFRFNV